MRTVRIGTPSKAYDVLLGRGLLDEAGELAARAVPVGAAALVTDDTVDALYSERLAVSLKSAGFRVVKHVFLRAKRPKTRKIILSCSNSSPKTALAAPILCSP
jgi:3-dehydroquinate synthetase